MRDYVGSMDDTEISKMALVYGQIWAWYTDDCK